MADEPVFLQDGVVAIHADDVVCDLAGAIEGEGAALVVVADLVVEAPAGEFQARERGHLGSGARGDHDGIAAVHVTGADLHICDDALGPCALGSLI